MGLVSRLEWNAFRDIDIAAVDQSVREILKIQGSLLPTHIYDMHNKSIGSKNAPVLVQIVEIVNISQSLHSQAEKLEDSMAPQGKKYQHTVEETNIEEDAEQIKPTYYKLAIDKSATQKFLLQDVAKTFCWGYDLFHVLSNHENIRLGTKLLLHNCKIARGTLLLMPESVQVLGGSIASWNERSQEQILERIKELRDTAAAKK